jgi:hypothetical protein
VTNTITAGAGDGGVKAKTAQSATATIAVKTAKDRITEASGTTATITLYDNETVAAFTVDNANSNITLVGSGGVRVLTLSAKGSNTVSAGSLTLGNNVTLKGIAANTGAVVIVSGTGTFTMNIGSTITGNTGASYGGVYVNGGVFNMTAGTISGNGSVSNGGGVNVNSGNFNMSGGTINNNTAGGKGGGVYTGGGSFWKINGAIVYGDTDTTHGASENTAGTATGNGHAVYRNANATYRDATLWDGSNWPQ